MKYILCSLVVACFSMPLFASAETVLRFGDDVSIDSDETVAGDYYVYSGLLGNTSMTGTIAEDMYASGGVVTVNGSVHKDLSILAGSAQVHGKVDDDVRIVAGEVTIAEHVGGDVYVIAGTLTILSNAVIDGDVIFYGEKGEINGKVGGSILGSSQSLRIDSEVGKNVDIKVVNALTLGDKTNIKGTVNYTSLHPLVRAQNAIVAGDIFLNSEPTHVYDVKAEISHVLIRIFISLFGSLTLYLFFRKEIQKIVDSVHLHTLRATIFGLSSLIVAPIISLLLMVTVVGILIGALIFVGVIALYLLSMTISSIVLGSYISKWTTGKKIVTPLWIVVGTTVIQGCLLLPIIGEIVFICFIILVAGGIFVPLYKRS